MKGGTGQTFILLRNFCSDAQLSYPNIRESRWSTTTRSCHTTRINDHIVIRSRSSTCSESSPSRNAPETRCTWISRGSQSIINQMLRQSTSTLRAFGISSPHWGRTCKRRQIQIGCLLTVHTSLGLSNEIPTFPRHGACVPAGLIRNNAARSLGIYGLSSVDLAGVLMTLCRREAKMIALGASASQF